MPESQNLGEGSEISPKDPLGAADVSSVVEALSEFPAQMPPERLYRFYSPCAISSLTEGKLKLTPPAEFNDPFEVWAGLSEANLSEANVLRSVLTPGSLFRHCIEANYPKYDLGGVDFEQRLKAEVKRAPGSWRAHLKSMVDAIAGTCATEIGVSCFSGFSLDEFQGELGIHHWAMYGDSHRGFALAYDCTHPQMHALAESRWLFPVEYVEHRHTIDVSYFDEWNDRKVWRTFRQWLALKSRRAWEHEREWRLVFPIRVPEDEYFVQECDRNGRAHYFLKFWQRSTSDDERAARASIISAVFLGARASDALIKKVLTAVELPHLRHVEVCQMEPDATHYRLAAKQLRVGTAGRLQEMRANLVRRN